MSEQTPDVQLDGLHKAYGGTVVLDELSLRVERGELVTLLGPSGCGKTTTLNMIAGFIRPDRGSVKIRGVDMTNTPVHRRDLGMVFQSYSLFPHMNIAKNLTFGLTAQKVNKSERQQRVEQALDLVKMSGYEGRYPRELSGGQRQRVAIARALVTRPKLLLLDEPLSNLDAKLRGDLRSEIKRLQQDSGVTTVFVTHDQDEALSISDRVVVMSSGRIEQIGSPLEIYRHPTSEFVFSFVGNSNRLQASVKDAWNGRLTLDVGGQWLIDIGEEGVIGAVPPSGSSVTVCIRPEAVLVRSSAAALNEPGCTTARVGRIRAMSYLGAHWELEVMVNGEPIQSVVTNVEPEWHVGSEVFVGWPLSDTRLLPN